jgi:lysozyme
MNSLIEQLKRDEGLRLTPYKDTVGKLTVGYGRNLSDIGISKDEAEFLLTNDVRRAAEDLSRTLPWTDKLTEVRRAVLINMCFNMGLGGLLQFKTTLSLIQAGDYDKASFRMLQSKWATQVGDRAERLSMQLRTGEWV